MSPVTFAGAGVGLGLFLLARGLLARPAPLVVSLHRLERAGWSVADERDSAAATNRGVVASRIGRLLRGRLGQQVEKDLAVMEQPTEQFVVSKITTAIALCGIVIALGTALAVAGSPLPVGLLFVLVCAALGVGFFVPDITLRAQARARRAGFRHALSSYLDLVNVLLAGGAGIETSLEAAADAGDGWAFTQIRNALLRSRTMRQSPWVSFTELGETIDVGELAEIAASVRLAGEQGARIKASLSARASALRAHQMARIEAQAQAATERMGLPTVLMFVGFMVLLGYPAMQQIVRAL
ncbi:unannotated protein [freshwater metagenome]|uniref:Unannotated protein n=1 Tax=freshwater metagenome TaxID=449393 RepID=A0A6J7EV00_9ZZZZ|nr:secretion system protein [Actinomycetota bacterium]